MAETIPTRLFINVHMTHIAHGISRQLTGKCVIEALPTMLEYLKISVVIVHNSVRRWNRTSSQNDSQTGNDRKWRS